MIRYRYANLSPPAPMVEVTVRCPVSGAVTAHLPALIDTGADRSVLTRAVVDAIALISTGSADFQGFGSGVIECQLYLVDLAIRDLQPIRIEAVLGAAEPFIVLGRDVLNAHRILLDGPQLALEIG